MLNPSEQSIPSKVGAFDETIVIDHPDMQFLGDVLTQAKAGAPDDKLFQVSYAQWHREFQMAATSVELGGLSPPVPHQLRHGGATHDLLTRHGLFLDVQAKGRWASLTGVRRYCKPGRVSQLVEALPAAQRGRAERLAATIGEWI